MDWLTAAFCQVQPQMYRRENQEFCFQGDHILIRQCKDFLVSHLLHFLIFLLGSPFPSLHACHTGGLVHRGSFTPVAKG